MRNSIKQCGGHFRITKHLNPFAKRQVGCDDERGFFIKLADQAKQQRTAGGWKQRPIVSNPKLESFTCCLTVYRSTVLCSLNPTEAFP